VRILVAFHISLLLEISKNKNAFAAVSFRQQGRIKRCATLFPFERSKAHPDAITSAAL